MSPTDAVIKVAQERDLTREYVDLVCTGYNTGATNFQRENESGVLNKLADFPLADGTKVAQALWPAEVVPPAEKAASTVVSSDYSTAPRPVHRASVVLEKAAEVATQFETAPPLPTARDRVDTAFQKRSALRANTEQLRQNAADCQNRMLESLGRFSDIVKYSSLQKKLELQYALREVHGDAGETLMKYATVRNKITIPNDDPPAFRIDWDKGGFKVARECLDATRRTSEAKTAYSRGKEANDARVAETMAPFAQAPTTPGEKRSAGFIGGVLMKSLMDSARSSDKATDAASSSMADILGDPDHENEIRRIQAQTMLSGMMANDDVISGHDPDEVLEAYNEVSRLSPRSATQPALVRPWLRKRLSQGAVEPFEAAEMANVEKTITQTQTPGFSDSKVANVLDTTSLVR